MIRIFIDSKLSSKYRWVIKQLRLTLLDRYFTTVQIQCRCSSVLDLDAIYLWELGILRCDTSFFYSVIQVCSFVSNLHTFLILILKSCIVWYTNSFDSIGLLFIIFNTKILVTFQVSQLKFLIDIQGVSKQIVVCWIHVGSKVND